MMLLGSERYVTQNYQQHKTAEDYSGSHLSPIKITGRAKVVRVVNHYKVHEDSINYNDFIKNQGKWRDGDYYHCISITGKEVLFHKDELGGNCVEVEGYIGNQYYRYGMFHMASVNVQVGDIIDSNTVLGLQGNTGLVDSTKSRSDVTYGTHVHLEVTNANGTYINPREYALGNQVITYLEQSNPIDTSIDQLVVVADKINIRKEPTVNSLDLGDVFKGETYTILNKQEDDLYTWYQIKTNLDLIGWVAASKSENWIQVNKKVDPSPPVIKPEQPEEKPEQEEYNLLFTCSKTDVYYLTLHEGEQLYLKKKTA